MYFTLTAQLEIVRAKSFISPYYQLAEGFENMGLVMDIFIADVVLFSFTVVGILQISSTAVYYSNRKRLAIREQDTQLAYSCFVEGTTFI